MNAQPEPSSAAGGAGLPDDDPSPFARTSDLLGRLSDDPRAAAAALLAVALVAGFLWYRAGVGTAGAGRAGAHAAGAQPAGTRPAGALAGVPPVASTTSTIRAAVVVHVAGAVRAAGLYRLPAGSRVADAIDAAGGPAPRADLDRLNLAAKVVDGQRIAVARVGEAPPPGPEPSADAGAPGAPATGPLDLNAATAAQLEALPGVGPATAAAIIDLRTRSGGLRSVRDLLRVPGIGDRRFADLKDRVRV